MTEQSNTDVAEPKEKTKKRHHPMWHVVLYNDDYTPMEFVVEMLTHYFGHDELTATAIMLDVHAKGEGIAGTYTRDVAETKGAMVMHRAQEAGHPLATGIRPADA